MLLRFLACIFLVISGIEAVSPLHEAAYETHCSAFSNLDVAHPRLIIFFSGTPGMGKTMLSNYLANELQAVRIGADDSRAILCNHLCHSCDDNKQSCNDESIKLNDYLHYCLSKLDKDSSNHLIILDRSIDGIEEEALKLADTLCYDTYIIRLECDKDTVTKRLIQRENDPSIHLARLNKWFDQYEQFPTELIDYSLDVHEEWKDIQLNELVDAIWNKIRTVPSTDRDLPKTPPENVGALYNCLSLLLPVLQKHDIAHWATCGTALGIVRHGGMIPWDDDIDLAIYDHDIEKLLSAQNDLNEVGLSLYQANGYYKILKIGGEPIPIEEKPGLFYPWTYPFIDLFPQKEIDGIVHYSNERLRHGLAKEYFTTDQLALPLNLAEFGPLKLPLPHRVEEHLDRIYGTDWPFIAYAQLIHRLEKKIKKIKVQLVDFSPAEYTH